MRGVRPGSRFIAGHRVDKVHIFPAKLEDSIKKSKAANIVRSFISQSVMEHDENAIRGCFGVSFEAKRTINGAHLLEKIRPLSFPAVRE